MFDELELSSACAAQAFCYENGDPYNGDAEVLALTVDPSDDRSLKAMPGFVGNDLNGRKCLMKTYGAMYTEVRAHPGGETLPLLALF